MTRPSRPVTDLSVYGRQAEVVRAAAAGPRERAREILLSSADPDGDRSAGLSHALRVAAIIAATTRRGLRVYLVGPRELDLRRDHVDGPTGIRAMLAEARRSGAAEIAGSEVRFSNGSTISWAAVEREAEVGRLTREPVDVLLLDDLDELSAANYRRLVEPVLRGSSPAARVVAATRRLEGWAREHFGTNGAGGESRRRVIALHPDDLPEEISRTAEPQTFRDFINDVRPGFEWHRHTEVVVESIQRWVDGEVQHLAIFLPPQHGKSECGPRLGGAYVLRRHPADWASIVSYTSSRANSRNFDARHFYRAAGGEVEHGAGSVNEWRNVYGGGIWSAGLGAGQTGQSMTWGIIDDPDKDLADAISAASQRAKRDQYKRVWRGRESMFGSGRLHQLLIATRWDRDDTASFILKRAALAGERWHVVCLPALYDPEAVRQFTDPEKVREAFGDEVAESLPDCVTVEPDWREEEGEPICPAKRDRADWDQLRAVVGEEEFSAGWQQMPLPAEGGGIFDRRWFTVLDRDVPAGQIGKTSRGWDDGATEDGGDPTAGVLVSQQTTQDPPRLVIRHAVQKHIPGSAVKRLKVQVAEEDGPEVHVATPQDPGAAGKADYEATRDALLDAGQPPRRIHRARPSTKKAKRARPLASLARPRGWDPETGTYEAAGRLYVVRGPKGMVGTGNVALGDLLRAFHNFRGLEGDDDHLIDATVDAVAILEGGRKKIKEMTLY